MTSVSIADFSLTLRNFISDYDLPEEAKRLALKEIYDEQNLKAKQEISRQAHEREETGNEQSTQ